MDELEDIKKFADTNSHCIIEKFSNIKKYGEISEMNVNWPIIKEFSVSFIVYFPFGKYRFSLHTNF